MDHDPRAKIRWPRALIQQVAQRLGLSPPAQAPDKAASDEDVPCCEGSVHIAFRGKSDDRLYIAYNRRWREVRFFKKSGLRVYCAGCRRRLY